MSEWGYIYLGLAAFAVGGLALEWWWSVNG